MYIANGEKPENCGKVNEQPPGHRSIQSLHLCVQVACYFDLRGWFIYMYIFYFVHATSI